MKKDIQNFKKILKTSYKVLRNKPFPLFVDFRITNRCNGRCLYCGIPERKEEEMDTDRIISLIHELSNLGCMMVNLIGGEIFLHPEIERIVKELHAQDIKISAATNGTNVPQYTSIIKKMNLLGVSIDGPEKVNDKIRGKGSYQRAIQAIDLIKAHKGNVLVLTTLSKLNKDHLKQLSEICKEKGVKFFCAPVYTDPTSTKKNASIALDQEEIEEFADKSKEMDNLIMDKYYFHYLKYGKGINNCHAGKFFCEIDPDGTVQACQDIQERDNSIKEAYFNEAFQKLNKNTKNCRVCHCKTYMKINQVINSNLIEKLRMYKELIKQT